MFYKKDYTFRCSTCNVNWPHEADYKACLQCGTLCWPKKRVAGEPVLSATEAASIKAHVDFEKYYEEREKRLMLEEADAIARSL